jgi:hypothetical protein
MKINISFGIFDSPDHPYGFANGQIEVDTIPEPGDIIDLLHGADTPDDFRILTKMPVRSVRSDEVYTQMPSVLLRDLLMSDRNTAASIVAFIDDSAHLYTITFEGDD